MRLLECFGFVFTQMNRMISACIRRYGISRFAKHGDNVYVGNGDIFTYDNVEIGSDVYIGANACFQSTYGKIKIGSHVMFGPGVHIHGGNHRIMKLECL